MKRKYLLMGSLASLSTLGLAVACGTSESNSSTSGQENKGGVSFSNNFNILARNGIYSTNINSPFSYSRSRFDLSSSYGGYSLSNEDTTFGKLVEVKNEGKAEYSEEVERDAFGTITKTTRKITRPSTWSYELNVADAVVLTVDGHEYTFDSDEAEIIPKPDLENNLYSSMWVQKTSANENSINSQNFFDKLKKATKVSLRIRDNVYWVNNKGEATQYKMSAEDYYLGFLRTYMSNDTSYRRSHGGSSDLDAASKALYTKNGAKLFEEKDTYSNSYLFDLYKISIENLLNEEKTVTNKDNRSYFNVTTSGDDALVYEWFTNNFVGSYEYAPAPSAYINAVNQGATLPDFATDSTVQQPEKEQKMTQIKAATDLAQKSGIYWYGFNENSTLYSGKYYYEGYNGDNYTATYKINNHYALESYYNDPTTVKEFRSVYVQQTKEGKQFEIDQFNAYKAGLVSTISYSNLPESSKKEVNENPKLFGVNKQQSLNADHSIGNIFSTLVPRAKDSDGANSYVNEVYSQLVWGHSLSEIEAGTATNVLEYTTTGIAEEFRNILTAAVNWSNITTVMSPTEEAVPWLSTLAPDSAINSDASDKSATNNSPRYNWELLSTLFVVDNQTNQKVDLGGTIGNELEPSESTIIGISDNDKYKSGAFAELQKRMKALLDKFYEEHPTLKGKNVEFKLLKRYKNYPQTYIEIVKGQIDTINQLDSRLKATYVEELSDSDFYSYWLKSSSPVHTAGWGYDYKSIGSGIDGLSWGMGKAFPILMSVLGDSAYKAKLEVSYPTIVKAAKKLGDFLEHNKNTIELSITPSKVKLLTNAQMDQLSDLLGTQKFDEQGQLVNLTEQDLSSKKYKDGYTISAQFFSWLNNGDTSSDHFTKKELLELAREFTNQQGTIVKLATTVTKNSFVTTILNTNYISPVDQLNYVDLTKIRIVK
ncbi:OppA family ABC transporter substrate-binding lipoprotein [Mycoplasma sp. CSL7503-lung]|uniref:OppA family ABC transporter substrate-binding lipoprotein n=1 Tax=Mycoplasma sp. CSL7503-lung TaxID=536372 RepID=UPI0021CE2949|nr:hypothetical protein [Mycoplasma sp. CSL7503-lung]MCU4706366.1 hypothetical protein [Mycoplasma sp. CSL7503-lung]